MELVGIPAFCDVLLFHLEDPIPLWHQVVHFYHSGLDLQACLVHLGNLLLPETQVLDISFVRCVFSDKKIEWFFGSKKNLCFQISRQTHKEGLNC